MKSQTELHCENPTQHQQVSLKQSKNKSKALNTTSKTANIYHDWFSVSWQAKFWVLHSQVCTIAIVVFLTEEILSNLICLYKQSVEKPRTDLFQAQECLSIAEQKLQNCFCCSATYIPTSTFI